MSQQETYKKLDSGVVINTDNAGRRLRLIEKQKLKRLQACEDKIKMLEDKIEKLEHLILNK